MSTEFRKRVVELDKRYVWHPYTEMSQYRENVDPLVIVEARGVRLIDANGRSYLDANGSCRLGRTLPKL